MNLFSKSVNEEFRFKCDEYNKWAHGEWDSTYDNTSKFNYKFCNQIIYFSDLVIETIDKPFSGTLKFSIFQNIVYVYL